MGMAVKVQFEIGHTSKLRSKKTAEGFTHDWELYVQGVNKADISAFVEKVVFNLHDSFPKPKRAFKEPPYVLKESGYAGFLLPIDIYFRNTVEPKRVQFTYDLDLQNAGPPQHRSDVRKFIFECPSEEFRQKLMKGGGVAVSGVVGGTGSTPTSLSAVDEGGMVSKPKLSSESVKKHKSREDSKLNTFANLFGTPITKSNTKFSPDGKNSGGKNANSMGGGGIAAGIISGNVPGTMLVGGGPSGSSGTPNSSTGNVNSTSATKEKSIKERDKSNTGAPSSNNNEKLRDKSEKRDRHKQTSPSKETRFNENRKSTNDGPNKHDKRSEDKPKKEKSRDKDRDRSRDKTNASAGSKRSLSPKTAAIRDIVIGPTSPKRTTPPRSSSSASGRAIEDVNKLASKGEGGSETISKTSKSSKEQSSSSSGKKSKKEKKEKERDKDKEKEKDREKNLEHKEKHRTETKAKDDRSSSNIPQGYQNNQNSTEKEMKILSGNDVNKKADKSPKADSTKSTTNKTIEKVIEKDAGNANPNSTLNVVTSTSSADKKHASISAEKDKKSHKHKKKDKSKDKDKEKDKVKEREKDKDKERDKDKDKDKEQVKDREKAELVNLPSSETFHKGNQIHVVASSANSIIASTPATTTIAATSSSASKKSQNKEKKLKDKSNKEDKRSRDENSKNTTTSTKHAKTTSAISASSSSNTNNSETNASSKVTTSINNIEMCEIDHVHSDQELSSSLATGVPPPVSNITSTLTQHSDSSNSSFPELPTKASSHLPAPVTCTTSKLSVADIVQTVKEQKTVKEHKQSRAEKNTGSLTVEAATPSSLGRVSDKEEAVKKRRRNSTAVNTFVEPAVKQPKKDTNKATREKSKSPSLRSGRRSSSSSIESNTFLPPSTTNITTSTNSNIAVNSSAIISTDLITASSPASASTSTSTIEQGIITSNANITTTSPTTISTAAIATITTNTTTSTTAGTVVSSSNSSSSNNNNNTSLPVAASTLPMEYLTELQELHHKIMTLQDNEELQQVVEMIAATGCYEITAKTFDFDLCKLDRNTVQRLQEFFATSVS